MRHGKKFNHLGRKTAHRKAMLTTWHVSNRAQAHYDNIAKAKALKKLLSL